MSINRRTFLAASGFTAGAGLLSACSSSGGGAGTASKPSDLQVFSWWTDGGEAKALDTLRSVFNVSFPNINFKNEAVAGGGGGNARTALKERLAANNPPDSFQAQAGANVGDYITAGQLEDLTFLYKQNGWDKKFNKDVLNLIQRDGKYYSVPVDIHHINVLWSNPKLCDQIGISYNPATIDEFISNLAKAKQHGLTPLAVCRNVDGESWQVQHIMECTLVSCLGKEGWTALWKPGADWSTSAVTHALQQFDRIMAYAPVLPLDPQTKDLIWNEVTALVGKGKAVYQVMGDWVDAAFAVDLSLSPNVGYKWAAFPGTQQLFDFAADCFTLPKGAPNREGAIDWLTTCGTAQTQIDFTAVKGAIPPSAIAPKDEAVFDSYLQWSLAQWGNTEIVGSLTHGVMAGSALNGAIGTAVAAYGKSSGGQAAVAALQTALVTAVKKYLP